MDVFKRNASSHAVSTLLVVIAFTLVGCGGETEVARSPAPDDPPDVERDRWRDAVLACDVDTLKSLLEDGQPPDARVHATLGWASDRITGEFPPVVIAADRAGYDVIELLAEFDADLNARGPDGRPALHYAVVRFDSPSIIALVDGGADINATDDQGQTPLHVAARFDHPDMGRVLLHFDANPNVVNDEGMTALMYTVLGAKPVFVRQLLKTDVDLDTSCQSVGSEGENALHFAVRRGNPSVVKALLDAGMDVDSRSLKFGRTPLMFAAGNPHGILTMKLLVERGADVNARSGDGETPLLWAVQYQVSSDDDIIADNVRYLLEAGAVPPPIEVGRRNLLTAAMESKLPKTIDVLLDAGMDVNARVSEYGETLLTIAVRYSSAEIVRVLLEHGADPNASDNVGPAIGLARARDDEEGPKIVRLLEERLADSEVESPD